MNLQASNVSRLWKLILISFLAVGVLIGAGKAKETGMAADGKSFSIREKIGSVESGPVESGKLVYINDGKQLGSESYSIRKKKNGSLALSSEGVVTPPIPIPFVKPKIKFTQEIMIDSNLEPVSLDLQYKGPLGIGNKKIRATVSDGKLEIKRGKKEQRRILEKNRYVFAGTSSSRALLAIILSAEERPDNFTEIRSGGTGPQGGDETRILVDVALESKTEMEISLDGNSVLADVYTYREVGTEREAEALTFKGRLIAYRVLDEENSFYVYREDLLGKDFRF